MDELKNAEERNNPEKSAGWPFSNELTEAWERLEERTRRRPGFHLFLALIVGYFLRLFPFRSLLMLFLKLCVVLTRPVLLLVCAFQLIKHLSKRSDSDAVPS